MKNHLGNREYQSYSGWKTAIKQAAAPHWLKCHVRYEGNKDIASALLVDQKGIPITALGEWGGDVGDVNTNEHINERVNKHFAK